MSRKAKPIRLVVYGCLLVALGAALVVRTRWQREQRASNYDRLGMSYFNQGNLAAAAPELRREIALAPGSALAYYKLGIIELQRGQHQQAREALSRAIALGVDQPRASCALGLAAFRMSDYGAAVAALRQCLARNPADGDARYLLAASYLGQARLDEAERGFKELLRREPKNGRFLYSLGTVYLYRPPTPANNAAALAALRQAVALGGAPPGAYYSLGLVSRRAGRWQEAAAALEAALRRDPRMLEARHALGLVYRRLGNETEASEQFRIARAQSAAAQRDRRLGYLQGEVQRNPMNPIVHYQLGCLYDELKENASARAEFEAAASLDPTMPDPHERLAQLDERVNRPREAQQERAIARRLSRELGSRQTVPFRYHSASLRPASATASPSRMPAVHFTDVTEPAGIHFRHTNGGFGRKYLPETMGAGCAFLDYDGDGWLDILLLNGKPLSRPPASRVPAPSPTAALYRNNRDGTFSDVTHGSGLEIPLYAMGCAVGDYDNDGRDDLYITTCMEPNRLFHNEDGGKFRDVTEAAGVGDRRWSTSCAWVDYDSDGWLDLFVCNYLRFRSLKDDKFCTLVPNRKSYCPPGAYAGEACILYHNNRDGTFTDVSEPTGIARHVGNSLGVAILDFDNDGWPDIAVANDETPNYLFHNIPGPTALAHSPPGKTSDGERESAKGRKRERVQEGATSDRSSHAGSRFRPFAFSRSLRKGASQQPPGRRFEEIGVETGFAVAETGKPKAGMGIDAADYRNDGSLGILVSNFSNEGLSFYRREDDLFSEVSFATGFGAPSLLTLGFGLFFFDMDNDGLKDAFVANGHVNDDIQLLQGNLTYDERHLLFRNRGDGSFDEIGREAGAPFAVPEVSRGAACGDFDNDGRLDILVTNNNGRAELLRSDGSRAGNWLQVEVRGSGGSRTNRSGIGARVRVKAGNGVQTDWARSGSSYLSQSMLRRHFGLGTASRADWVEVTWTNGRRQRIENVGANQRIRIEEEKGG